MQINSFPDQLIPHIDSKLPFQYTEGSKRQVKSILENWVNDQAPKRVLVEWITIDWAESKDLDDGIWAERKKDWWYTIFVSIADPTEYIDILSSIDIDAMNKWTSIYLNEDSIIHMLPKELATDLVSLNHNTTRLSQTVQIDYNDQMDVISTEIYESKFYNKNRFDYSEFKEQYFNEWHEFHNRLRLLDEIGQKLRKKRLAKWIIVDFDDAERYLWKSFSWWKNIASRLIEELMVSTNIQVALFQEKNYEKHWIYRNHMPELEWVINIPKQLERAFYLKSMMFHYWLKEKSYTHFTSPIRRYFDFILHRQLKAFLRNDEFPYDEESLRKIINRYLNGQLNKVYFLEKAYHFEEKVKKKYKKVHSKTNWDVSLKDMKINLQHWVKQWLKLPKIMRDNIIDKINWWAIKWDWMRLIGTYILSDEKEIIEALRDRLLNWESKWRYRNILNSISSTKLTRRRNDVIFTIREKNKKIHIFINNSLVVRWANTPKEAIIKLFNYSLKK